MRKKIITFLPLLTFFCLLGVLMIGCNEQETLPPKQTQPIESTTKLVIGLIPEQNIFAQKKLYEPLLAYIAKQLGVAIEMRTLPRYGNIIENYNDIGLDGAFFGSFTGALAIRDLGVEPLARPKYNNGSSTYYGMVFVRKGSGIRSAQDMKGKRMVFVDKATTAGYLLPLSYFKSIGISDYTKWFGEYYFSGTHEDAILDVLNGFADIGAAKNTIFYRLASKDPRVTKELDILATSPHVPSNCLSVRHDLPDNLKQALKKQLLTMHESDEGRAVLEKMEISKFLMTTVADYKPVFDYTADIGINLKTYNYRNN